MSEIVIGKKAPALSLKDSQGNVRKLAEFAGKKTIIYFYPAALTPGCTKQACDFRDNLAVLSKQGFQVVGISPDKPEKLATFIDTEDLPFLLLSDPEHTVMETYGAWGEKSLYGKTVVGVIRSTIILDEALKVTHEMHNVKATGHVAKLMRDLNISA